MSETPSKEAIPMNDFGGWLIFFCIGSILRIVFQCVFVANSFKALSGIQINLLSILGLAIDLSVAGTV